MLQVYITAAAAGEKEAAGHAAKYDSYALDKISIRVSPKVFGSRIRRARMLVLHHLSDRLAAYLFLLHLDAGPSCQSRVVEQAGTHYAGCRLR